MKLFLTVISILLALLISNRPKAQSCEVIAYYTGDAEAIDSFQVDQLTQIIYSFLHLKGNRLTVDNPADSLTIRKLASLKRKHPRLKVLLSLGGWGGCRTCSEVFSEPANQLEFAESVLQLLKTFEVDGIDMDWEYPGIPGYPDHPWKSADKENFTELIRTMRTTLGPNYQISFAAGGFTQFFDASVEWDQIMPLVDRVNIMTYDLVSGFATQTGHHTPLYSTSVQERSTDYAISYLDSLGVPKEKMVIGGAFYGRVWEGVAPDQNGLYQPGTFLKSIPYHQQPQVFEEGFELHWDEEAQAPYGYDPNRKWFITYDDQASIRKKTEYAIAKGLGGIMFWQLTLDKAEGGLLQTINDVLAKD